jgi:hypothetical protein
MNREAVLMFTSQLFFAEEGTVRAKEKHFHSEACVLRMNAAFILRTWRQIMKHLYRDVKIGV